MEITALSLAQRYIGIREIAGDKHQPLIVWWHSLCNLHESSDEVPWCSSFVNGIAWELRLPRSKSAMARSWLEVGLPASLSLAVPGFDVCIFMRGKPGEPQPGPEVLDAPGHVGFYAGEAGLDHVYIVGGNQADQVKMSMYRKDRLLGVRRLHNH